MRVKQKLFIFGMLFCSVSIFSSDIPVQERIAYYVRFANEWVANNCDALHQTSASGATTIAFVKIAFQRIKNDVFLPDEEAILCLLKEDWLNPMVRDSETGATLLHLAAFYGAYEVVRYLVHEVSVPFEVDLQGKTVLHWAVNPYQGLYCNEIVTLLVAAKRDLIHTRDFSGKSPFFYLSCCSEMGDSLLALGASINTLDGCGRTLLFELKNPETTRYLCSHGIDVNCQDESQLTALGSYLTGYSMAYDLLKTNSCFARNLEEYEEAIRVLLEYGCSVPRGYHPAFSHAPLHDKWACEEQRRRLQVLSFSFGIILEGAEEKLKWVKTRLNQTQDGKKPTISPLLVFDTYSAAVPFFEARFNEMALLKEEEPYDAAVEFRRFLSRLSLKKYISSELHCMACDLVLNKEEYGAVQLLSEAERSQMGERIIEKIFSNLEHPDDHAA